MVKSCNCMDFLQRIYRTRIFIASIIALSLLATPSFASQLNTKKTELTNIKKRIEANQRQQSATKEREADILREIQANDRKIVELQDELDKLKVELEKKITERNLAELKLAKMERELAALEAELTITEKKLAHTQDILNNRATAIYKKGSSGMLAVILSSSNLSDLFKRLGFIEMIANNDAKLVAEVQETKEATEERRDRVAASKKIIAKKYLILVDQGNQVKKARKRVSLKYELFHNELKRQERLLARIEREMNRLKITEDMLESSSKLVASQIRTLENGGTISYGRAVSGVGFMRPCTGRITSKFGWRKHPVLGYSRLHAGVDFGIPTGTPVYAAQSGTIILAGRMGGYGNTVVISHGGGVSTLYGHNSKLRVKVGQKVSRGDVIASSGSTGLSTGPHLHFEVRVNGTPKNPMNWIN